VAALGLGKRRGKGSNRTRSSPGGRRWARFGRRGSAGEQFGRRRNSGPARNRRWWRRLEAPRVNSLNGEVEDDIGDLLSTSVGLGEARDSGARRGAPVTVSFT
jgi:hypothetical protein